MDMESVKLISSNIYGITPDIILSPENIHFRYSFVIDEKSWVIYGKYCKDSCDGDSDHSGFGLKINIEGYVTESWDSCAFPFSRNELETKGMPLSIDEEYAENLFKALKIIDDTLQISIEKIMLEKLMEKYAVC